MPRTFFVGGNHKLNVAPTSLITTLTSQSANLDANVQVVIAPPTLYLLQFKSQLASSNIQLAAQNSYTKSSGAFTGETSAVHLKEAGIPWVILGHSERRTLFGETSQLVAEKTKAAIDAGLSVILCIGETLQERQAGKTKDVSEEQLQAVVSTIKSEDWSKIVVAYEPVWAIGTGHVATTAQAQEAHLDIRSFLKKSVSGKVADETRIIYGGSVTAANSKELATQPDVDGFLVGGASLKPEFVDIINSNVA